MDYSALAEQVRGLGAYKAGVVDLQDVRFDRAFRAMCETNACGNYGKCWMCPPDAGDIDALMNEAQSYQKALVYQTVGTLEDSYDFESMMEAARRKGSAAAASSTRLPACWSWSSWTRPGFWSRTLRPLRRLYA